MSTDESERNPHNNGDDTHSDDHEDSHGDSQDEMNDDINDDDEEAASPSARLPDLARHHSYLPPTSLLLQETRSCQFVTNHDRTRNTTTTQSDIRVLPVLELPFVIFPGSTLPLRLTDTTLQAHLRHAIQKATTEVTSKEDAYVFIGILLQQEESQTQPSSSPSPSNRNPTNHTDQQQQLQQQQLQQQQQQQQQRVNQRRRSWMRQGYGPERLRRISQRVIQELGEEQMLEEHVMEPHEDREPSEDSENDGEHHVPPIFLPSGAQPSANNPYFGRIGTLANVIYVHDNNNVHDSCLTITAQGVGRFRILASTSGQGVVERAHLPRIENYHGQLIAGIRMFQVQIIYDAVPSSNHVVASCPAAKHRNPQLGQLEAITGIPAQSWQSVWPQQIVDDIAKYLQQISEYKTLWDAVPDTTTLLHDPERFSYWLASNLPFSVELKQYLLQVNTVERLRYIKSRLERAHQTEKVLQCRSCLMTIAHTRHMFTVGGAEGTNAAYVNEHGCVHQTITLKEIDEEEVMYYGGAETKDSWFPGYSWTIMSCGLCGAHLGWKFHKVPARVRINTGHTGHTDDTSDSRNQSDGDRPAFFWGLSSASVVTTEVQRRRQQQQRIR